ncbi:MAG: hypothetical protein ACLUDQ_11895 [Bilophila wadsworthia]
MNASRFAHYVKANMRDKVGSFMTADNVSKYLNNWISQYVLLSDDAGDDIKARYPLREARVDVSEDPGNPGAYKCDLPEAAFQLRNDASSVLRNCRCPRCKRCSGGEGANPFARRRRSVVPSTRTARRLARCPAFLKPPFGPASDFRMNGDAGAGVIFQGGGNGFRL